MLPYSTAFDTLDPKEGLCVSCFSPYFSDISNRARKLLAHRSANEIRAATTIIDWLDEETEKKLSSERLEALAQLLDEGRDEISDIKIALSPCEQLVQCLEHVKLDDKEDFPKATKAEYNAVLALCLIGLACEEQKILESIGLNESHPLFLDSMGAYGIEAMEAIVTAELLTQTTEPAAHLVETSTKKQISLQNSRAARKRHEPVQRFKADFFRWYRQREKSGGFHSMVQAAQQFYDSRPPDQQRLLAPTNAIRTLTEALSKYLKGRH